MDQYLENQEIKRIVSEAQNIKKSKKIFSDIVDEEGNQYVDLVQEGGGVLGIALVGYTYIMEEAGIRFLHLAGTSAGAINTMMVAALGEVHQKKSKKILELLSEQNLFDFVDGHKRTKNLIQAYINGASKFSLWSRFILNILFIFRTLKNKLGLNPGNTFQTWVEDILVKNKVDTIAKLLTHRKKIPVLSHRTNPAWSIPEMAKIVIISAEITTQSKIEFPEMAHLYWKDWQGVNPANLVRASMSIPYFFRPYEIKNIPNAGANIDPNWNNTVGYDGIVPKAVKFVDGGLLSNFPINVFHTTTGKPSRPTFGAKLSALRKTQNKTDSLIRMSGSMLNTVRHLYDYDFLLRNPDYRQLITSIDPDPETFNWLDFEMDEGKKAALFLLGAQKALAFLNTFSWAAYKASR